MYNTTVAPKELRHRPL